MGNNSSTKESEPAGKPGTQEKKQKKKGGSNEKEFTKNIHKTDQDFEINDKKVTLKNKHGAFIAFYAPWCHYCHDLAPNWNKYAKQMKGTSFHFLAVDCTSNDCSKLTTALDIQGYPTIMFADPESGEVMPAVYQDGTPMQRTEEGIKRFLQEKQIL